MIVVAVAAVAVGGDFELVPLSLAQSLVLLMPSWAEGSRASSWAAAAGQAHVGAGCSRLELSWHCVAHTRLQEKAPDGRGGAPASSIRFVRRRLLS